MATIRFPLGLLVLSLAAFPALPAFAQQAPTRFPADKATNVNPDTHLVLTFSSPPTVGASGKIRIIDTSDNKVVDTLDMSIPPGPTLAPGAQPVAPGGRGGRGGGAGGGGRGGAAARGGAGAARGAAPGGAGPAAAPGTTAPAGRGAAGAAAGGRGGGRGQAAYSPTPYPYDTPGHATNANTVAGTPSGVAVATPNTSQLTIIGGFSDGFHFYPIIVRGNTATIYPHNNLLEYNKTYRVEIDPGVLTTTDNTFNGFSGDTAWTFTTKKAPPPADSQSLIVAADGSGDFNTVQGAIDFTPDHSSKRITIFVKNGQYEEIVYFRNKDNLTIQGEDQAKTHVVYANAETLNPHPSNVATNEWPGTYPSRRAAFMADNSNNIALVNFTAETLVYGQAEGLLINGKGDILSNMTVIGTGDGIQLNGSVYLVDTHFTGAGDSILGRGATFWDHCLVNSNGIYMWIRNTDASHGNVFLDCTFETLNGGSTALARAPVNGGRAYPNAEVVLINCKLAGIDPAGWGPFGGDTSKMHLWEFNSTNLSDGKPVDVSQRADFSKQLDAVKDADTIKNYSNPTFVLGFTPTLAPAIVQQPQATKAAAGQPVILTAKAAGVPAPTYQWLKNGSPIAGATSATLTLNTVTPTDAGNYTVTATNASGTTTSDAATLTAK